MEVKDEWQIAISRAKLLHKLRYWGYYSTTSKNSSSSSSEEVEHARLQRMASELAMSRARATGRDLKMVLKEVELKILINLATLLELAPSVHPVVENQEDSGEICGVCQEEMEKGQMKARAMDCMHTFHHSCIWKWMEIKSSCPLCRRPL